MTPTRLFAFGVTLAMLAVALGARAQQPPRKPFDPHDWHDERYQRPAPAAGPAGQPARQDSPPHHRQHRGESAAQQPAHQHDASATPPSHQHGQTPAAPPGGHEHGMPAGWKFALPTGNADRGRDVFTKLECFACHEVKGQSFPGVRDGGTIGPELSGMAAHHDAEFFAEAIINPSAVIDRAAWRAADGTSKMPSFNDSITVQELVDLVAFLKSLTPPSSSTSEHKH